MPKYEASAYRCNVCGEHFHSEDARDLCERRHRVKDE